MLYRASCPIPGCGGHIEYWAFIGDESADTLCLDAAAIVWVELRVSRISCGCQLSDHDILVARENVQDELRGLLARREKAPWLRWRDLEAEFSEGEPRR